PAHRRRADGLQLDPDAGVHGRGAAGRGHRPPGHGAGHERDRHADPRAGLRPDGGGVRRPRLDHRPPRLSVALLSAAPAGEPAPTAAAGQGPRVALAEPREGGTMTVGWPEASRSPAWDDAGHPTTAEAAVGRHAALAGHDPGLARFGEEKTGLFSSLV